MPAEVPRWHRAGVPDRRESPAISGGAGRFSVPSHSASPRPIRAWQALVPQACGPAAAGSRARKVARHRQVQAVALDQAADDARGIKHALDTDRRGQPGSARPCSVTLGIAPSLAPLDPQGPGPGPANGPVLRLWSGSPAALGSPCRCCFRQPQRGAVGLVQEQGSSTQARTSARGGGVSARLSTQPRPIQNLSSWSRAARRGGSLSDDACGRARPCCRMGSVLAVLARGGLFYEEGRRAVVPRAGDQGGNRGRRDRLALLGRLSGGTASTWSRGALASGLALFFAGLGFAIWARVHLGRDWGTPMTQKDEPELVTSGPCHLVRHPIYSGILVAGVGAAVALSWLWLTAVAWPVSSSSTVRPSRSTT